MRSPDPLRRSLLTAALALAAGCAAEEHDPLAVDGSAADVRVTDADATPDGSDAMSDDSDAILDGSDAILDGSDAMPDDSDAMPVEADATPAAADGALDAAPDPAPDAAVDAALDPGREHRCDDGLDDDGDGTTDCADGDCLDDAPCVTVPENPVQRVQEIFLQRCGCHTGALDLGGLRLVRPFTDTTVGVPAVLDPEQLLVAPGDAEASFLYLKLLDGLPPDLGERMPPEIPYLDAGRLAEIAGWIDGLAP